ncbi:MAG TPA: VWA domain-containing protein [Pirellulales bacterium]|nr:VWA domain-containing protein [Pirellulales bacterium]
MSGILPNWLEQWLGVEAVSPGEGTAWSLENTWSWAPWVTLLFAMFAIVWVAYFYAREGPTAGRAMKALLVAVRLALIAIVLFMIAEFSVSLRRTGLPTVAVVVDDSASMGIDDRYDDQKLQSLVASRIEAAGFEIASRLNLAKSLLLDKPSDLLAAIHRRYRLKLYFVSSAARAQSGTLTQMRDAIGQLQPRGESTRLGAGVRHVLSDLRGTPPAAIVLLTDGINTEGETIGGAARYARRKGVPLFAIGLGSEQPVRDLELTDLLVDEVVFVDDVVNFEYKLTGRGFGGKTVDVVLREKDSPAVLAQMKVKIDDDGKPQRLRLPYRPSKVGEFEYVVEVEHLSDEAQNDNNRQQRLVSVRKEQISVLLVQAYPNYEFRYLKNMLERDSTIQLKTVLQEADLEYAELDQTALRVFPVRREELFAYDVVIFGDVNPAFLSASVLENLSDFVEKKGGGVAFISGQSYTPLAFRNTPLEALFPVDLAAVVSPDLGSDQQQGFVVQPTELGMASPQMQLGDSAAESARIWQDLPPLYWLLEAPAVKPAARVLAEHPSRVTADGRRLPVFITQFVGAGKVLFHATDDTWRWRYRVGDVFFARYWVQAVRYLSRSKLLGKDHAVELAADRRQYRRGEPVRLRARFIDERQAPAEDDGVVVVLELEGHKNERIKLERDATSHGIFEATFGDAMDGKYHAWIASPSLEGKAPSADFLVAPPPGEMEHVQMDSAELKRAADETRGHFYRVDTVGRLLDDLPSGHQVPIETLPPHILWNRWWLLLAFVGLIVSEWILRKRKGML